MPIGKTSNIELLARKVLLFVLPENTPNYNVRPDWLKNPKTKKNLELDIYYPELFLGIEVNSIFHRRGSQSARDKVKNWRCYDRGIILLRVWNKQELLKLPRVIYEYVSKNFYHTKVIKEIPEWLTNEVKSYEPNLRAFNSTKLKLPKKKRRK